MQVPVLIVSLLLQGGAPAVAAAPPSERGLDTYSLCVAEGVEPGGKARYVTDPFETGLDEMDARGFQEYVEQAYLHRRDSGYRTVCTSYSGHPAVDRAYAQATKPVAGVKIVATKWRANFE